MSIQKFEFILLCVLMILLLFTLFIILNNTYNLRLINSKYKTKLDIHQELYHKKKYIIDTQNILQQNLIKLLKQHKNALGGSNNNNCKKRWSNLFEKKVIPSVKQFFHNKKVDEENINENKAFNDYDDNTRWSYI